MQDLFDKVRAKLTGKPVTPKNPLITTVATQYEINLVPEVKAQMIRAQKLRNLVLFICIMVSVVSVGAVLILFGIKSGQDIAMASQDKKLETLSEKLTGYEEIGDLVTIQSQLARLDDISKNKALLSRVFGALKATLPTGGDQVQFSELRVDLDTSVIRMEAQADAVIAPLIDYRVLESFKKGVALTKYDYGRFVDANDKKIPTWCVHEADENGNAYMEGENYYAWWDLTAEGCAALSKDATVPENSKVEFFYNPGSEVEQVEKVYTLEDLQNNGFEVEVSPEGEVTISDESLEPRQNDEGITVYARQEVTRVKIWRTPQFTKWNNAGWMNFDGSISGVEHFESSCIQYSGATQPGTEGGTKWTSTNECMLVPDGLTVSSSSNGRDESDNLVLKFTASMKLDPKFFVFRNKHMIAIGPMGQNVTDSYVQIGGMFTQEARECDENDAECLTNSTNTGGSANSENNNGGDTNNGRN